MTLSDRSSSNNPLPLPDFRETLSVVSNIAGFGERGGREKERSGEKGKRERESEEERGGVKKEGKRRGV